MQTHLKPKIEEATRRQFPDGIDEYGADALRFTFASLATTGRDIRFDLGRIEGYKNFCNKLWNASRYVLMNTEALDDGDTELSTADRWVLSRLQGVTASMHECMKTYRLDLAAQAIYDFTWHEFCDWYLELSKPVLQSDDTSDAEKRGTRRTLIDVLESILRLLHPLMPFVTEEIWQQVAPRAGIVGETIMLRPYPEADDGRKDPSAEAELDWIMQFILGIRQIRGEMDISPGKSLPVLLESPTDSDLENAERNRLLLTRVGRVESFTPLAAGEDAPPSATALLGDMRLLVPMAGLIDVEAERSRLGKQRDKADSDLKKSRAKLANENFVNNAPEAVVIQEKSRVTEFEQQIAQLDEQLARLDSL
jgi:valyl-tRNA synthetase